SASDPINKAVITISPTGGAGLSLFRLPLWQRLILLMGKEPVHAHHPSSWQRRSKLEIEHPGPPPERRSGTTGRDLTRLRAGSIRAPRSVKRQLQGLVDTNLYSQCAGIRRPHH